MDSHDSRTTTSLFEELVRSCDKEIDVTADRRTDLKRLLGGDLDFSNSAVGGDRHSWHPFPAKFPPALPRLFIENLTTPGEVVLDPMMGSGTTLIEAASLGRKAVGFDIDPLSLINVVAKTCGTRNANLYRLGNSLINRAFQELSQQESKLTHQLHSRFEPDTLKFIDYWFS